jgi:ubiquinone biosynthesis protein UbiJ
MAGYRSYSGRLVLLVSRPEGVMATSPPQPTKHLVFMQSVLVGLQTVAAAGILGDIVGAKFGALFVVVVAAAQQGLNFYLSKYVGETVAHVENVIDTATQVTQDAKELSQHVATLLTEQHLDRDGN